MNRLGFLLFASALIGACAQQDAIPMPPVDILIVGGEIFDGTGTPSRRGNIAVRDGRIVSVSAAADLPAARVIDASQLIVTPGYIDPHTHAESDLTNPERKLNANFLTQGVTTVVVGNDGLGLADRERQLGLMLRQGIGPNVAFFAGHGQIRHAVMELADRAPTSAELDEMLSAVVANMRAGALGLSSGLYYAPGSYAKTDEVIALASVAAQHGGVYDTHLRSEGTQAPGLLSALDEAIEIGRRAQIPLHISHIKALGHGVAGQSVNMIEKIQAGLTEGLVISANQYPWEASGTRFSNALLPRWVMADSKSRMRERLGNLALLPRIKAEMAPLLAGRGGPEAMLITQAGHPQQGKTLAEAAQELELDPREAAIQFVLSGDPSIASFVINEADINRLAVQPWVVTGSDASGGHPRKFGSFPKAYQQFVVERNLMTLARFVQRSSGQVADILGICDRGYLRPGYRADIAVVNLDQYRANATYQTPTELSDGVRYLLINGEVAIDNGELTGVTGGSVIRKDELTCD